MVALGPIPDAFRLQSVSKMSPKPLDSDQPQVTGVKSTAAAKRLALNKLDPELVLGHQPVNENSFLGFDFRRLQFLRSSFRRRLPPCSSSLSRDLSVADPIFAAGAIVLDVQESSAAVGDQPNDGIQWTPNMGNASVSSCWVSAPIIGRSSGAGPGDRPACFPLCADSTTVSLSCAGRPEP